MVRKAPAYEVMLSEGRVAMDYPRRKLEDAVARVYQRVRIVDKLGRWNM
jgi:hypothetical protein